MCHRFYIDEDTLKDIQRVAAQVDERMKEMLPGDRNPTEQAPVITGRAPGLKAEPMAFGFSRTGKNLRMLNARAETVTEKPSFAESVRRRRCVVPAAHFYEWDPQKNKVTFSLPDRQTLYLAGIYDIRDNEEQFVIVTTAANDSMAGVHDRMPLILEEERIGDWILDPEEARQLLREEMPALDSFREYEQLSIFSFLREEEEIPQGVEE